jgi:hypothetical protein
VTPYEIALKSNPEKFTGDPWVRCPPFDRSMPRNVSPGLRNVVIAA